jgi:hypothetical protein
VPANYWSAAEKGQRYRLVACWRLMQIGAAKKHPTLVEAALFAIRLEWVIPEMDT